MTHETWQFNAIDSLFFGSGKPMNAGESSWIDSQFPPTGLTLQGAIRTAVLYYTHADIAAFTDGNPCLENGESLKNEIGDANSLGNLNLTGPFLFLDEELLLPAPLDLISNAQQHALLRPAKTPTTCDLGNIRLPSTETIGCKVSENCYVKHSDMTKLLSGDTSGIELLALFADHPKDKALADKEPKIGLARDNHTRNSVESMLFAIAPVRPRQGVSLRVRVQGIEEKHLPKQAFLQKLGGEGKLAHISVSNNAIKMPASQITQGGDTLRFKWVFTQPALMPVDGWLPEGFTQSTEKDCWVGQINNIPITIISACIGKPIKLGGWGLKQHTSKTHQAYIPAGSVYFCEIQAEKKDALLQLHDTKLGANCEYGFGHVLVGRW